MEDKSMALVNLIPTYLMEWCENFHLVEIKKLLPLAAQ